MTVKILKYSIWIAFLFFCATSLQAQDTVQRKFLFKSKFDTTRNSFGSHIELKEVLPNTNELIPLSIDDRDKMSRSGYNRADHIQILGEYLTFQGDTMKSNKRYHFKPAYYMTLPEDMTGFTIQVEALYSFTRLLTIGYPPIRPTIVDRKTGANLNTDLSVLNAIYDIYRNWYNQNKQNDFKSISPPLSGTPYAWLGEEKLEGRYFRSDLFDYQYKQ